MADQQPGATGAAIEDYLVEERTFPRAATKKACRYCRFAPVCGPDPTAVSREKLLRHDPESPAGQLARLHGAGEDATEDEANGD